MGSRPCPPGQEQMRPIHFQGLAFEDGVEISTEPPGIAGLLIPVVPFRAHPVNRGAKLFDEGLDGLRMQRKSPFAMRFELGFGGPSPMSTTAEPVNLDQTRPEVPCGSASVRHFVPFCSGKGHSIGEDRRLLHGARTGRHCVFNLHVHLVFVAKYRRLVFTNEILEDLRAIFSNVCQDFEATLEEFDGERDHVHLLITTPPKVAISRLVIASRASLPD